MATSQVIVKNVPFSVKKGEWISFVNKSVTGKRWRKNFCQGKNWCIIVNSNDAEAYKNALNGKYFQNNRLTAYIKGGRNTAFKNNNKRRNNNSYNNKNKNKNMYNKILNNEQKKQLIMQLSKRYNQKNRFLNLSNFVSDSDWCSFNNYNFCNELLDAIQKYCNTIITLDISSNNITHLIGLKTLPIKAPYLENISLLDNPLNSFYEFTYFEGFSMKLRELQLKNNKLLEHCNNESMLYLYEIKRRFQKLKLLDGNIMPINCNLSLSTKIDEFIVDTQQHLAFPISSHNSCKPSNDNGYNTIRKFIAKYYEAFDTNRQNLTEAYHSDALLSISIDLHDTPDYFGEIKTDNNNNNNNNNKNNNSFNPSFENKKIKQNLNYHDRNHVHKKFKNLTRHKQLQSMINGKVDITKFLCDKFPKTRHNYKYLTIDVQFIPVPDGNQVKLKAQVSIIGYWAEGNISARKFQRTMLVEPTNNASSLIIINDQVSLKYILMLCVKIYVYYKYIYPIIIYSGILVDLYHKQVYKTFYHQHPLQIKIFKANVNKILVILLMVIVMVSRKMKGKKYLLLSMHAIVHLN